MNKIEKKFLSDLHTVLADKSKKKKYKNVKEEETHNIFIKAN